MPKNNLKIAKFQKQQISTTRSTQKQNKQKELSHICHTTDHSQPLGQVSKNSSKTPSPIQVSETTLMKYCGGSGSNTGTKNFTVCSSWANLLQMDKYNLHFITRTKASRKKQKKEKKGVETHHRSKEKCEWEINKRQTWWINTHGSW